MWDIVATHELRGVQRATIFPGTREFLDELGQRGIKRGVLTRNSRASTLATLSRLQIEIDAIVSREDGPVKPSPAGILRICRNWAVSPRQCVMIGDYRFDIEAGRGAGARTVLFTGAGRPHDMIAGDDADLVLPSFVERARFWDWVAQIDLGGSAGCC